MWTSDRGRRETRQAPDADVGRVTLGGEPLGVYLEGERRWAQVYSPGGYRWQPRVGDQVLVLKTGGEGENLCIAGKLQEGQLPEGETELASADQTARVRLRPGGEIALTGEVTINGKSLEELVAELVRNMAQSGGEGENDGTAT